MRTQRRVLGVGLAALGLLASALPLGAATATAAPSLPGSTGPGVVQAANDKQ